MGTETEKGCPSPDINIIPNKEKLESTGKPGSVQISGSDVDTSERNGPNEIVDDGKDKNATLQRNSSHNSDTKTEINENSNTPKNVNDKEMGETIKLKDRTTKNADSDKDTNKTKKAKKGIFISYSPDAGYRERCFVVETVRQLKENSLSSDLWFDKDEKNTNSPCWFSFRMEAVEKCKAAILIISTSYFTCPVTIYEAKCLLERQNTQKNCVKIFTVILEKPDSIDIPKHLQRVLDGDMSVDLTKEHLKLSSAEKTSVVIGSFMEELEKYAIMQSKPSGTETLNSEGMGEYKSKKICLWSCSDLQDWLLNLGIKEFYCQSFAESMVDGFLLMSLTELDMTTHLGIESRVVRKKIMQQIIHTLEVEAKQADNWHLRARAQRTKPNTVYVIYDPADVRLAQNLKKDLKNKGLQVYHHDTQQLGKSKEEFLQKNCANMASSCHMIVLMTEAAVTSPFVFQEILFADWLGKKLVSTVFKNVWSSLRVSMKAVLGDCPAVDFETKMYEDSMDILIHHVKPIRRVSGVVLEQSYLNKMADGLKPLEILSTSTDMIGPTLLGSEEPPDVFVSYQWDMQSKVDEIQSLLKQLDISCWSDINVTGQQRSQSSRSSRSTSGHSQDSQTYQGQVQRAMRHCKVVLCCITPKYLQSENCSKDLALAETYNKIIFPLLLRYTPTESAPSYIRKLLIRYSCIDLSNERLYKQNIGLLLERVKKAIHIL